MDKIYKVLRTGLWAVAALCLSGTQVSCDSDDIEGDAMYTFTGETVASFCQNDPELTDFYQLITKCGADALLEVARAARAERRRRWCTTALSAGRKNMLHWISFPGPCRP